jgi:hypothetical protein
MSNNLTGFDMVWAITQKTINAQFQSLVAMLPVTESIGSLADPEQITLGLGDMDGKKFTQPLTLGPPTVDFNTGRPKLVNFRLPILSGKAAYLAPSVEKMTFEIATADLSGAVLGFEVDVNIARRGTDALGKGLKIPPEILAQLESFSARDFDIASLFLDFENSKLNTFREELSSFPDSFGPDLKARISAQMGKFLAGQAASDNPFILGHTAMRKTAPPAEEILAPTGTNYSTTPWMVAGRQPSKAEKDLSTLNFLLVGGGHSLVDDTKLSGPGAGMFDVNRVLSDEYDGVGVIDLAFFTEKYLKPFFIDPLQQRIQQVFGDYRHARDDRGPDVNVVEDSGGLSPKGDGLSWHYGQNIELRWHESGSTSHDRESFRAITFDVQLKNKPDPEAGNAVRLALEINGSLFRREKDQVNQDLPGKSNVYVGDGWAEATFHSSQTIYFTAADHGGITLRVANDPMPEPATNSGRGGIYSFADFFNDILGLHQISQDWDTNAGNLASNELLDSAALQRASQDMLQSVATRVVLPAPHVFAYHELVLNPQNDPEIRLTYQTQAAA